MKIDRMPGPPGMSSLAQPAAMTSGRGIKSNARRGQIDPHRRSYPPVESVVRAFDVLKEVNRQGIATVNALHHVTGIPKPSIVRLLETLMGEGYVARDNMCGGYRLTHEVARLTSGYGGVPRILEVARPLAVEMTRRVKWPIGLGVLDGDAIDVLFWTGAISPYAHRSTVIGLRADMLHSAMGRAYLAFCSDAEREQQLALLRALPEFDEIGEDRFLALLDTVRGRGYACRDPKTPPFETKTLSVPVTERGQVAALLTISLYRSAFPQSRIAAEVVAPLMDLRDRIEDALACFGHDGDAPGPGKDAEIRPDF